MNQWETEETRLWNAMQDPGRGQRRVTLHSIRPDDRKRKKQLQEHLEKQKARDFAAGWRNLQEFLRH
jgi:hypothetical protein